MDRGNARFDAEAHRLDIEIDFAPGSRFACPSCGAADCPAYDTERMTWRHLNFFQHQAYLNARVPRVRCDNCGVKKIAPPWARPDSGFTLLFEAMAMTRAKAILPGQGRRQDRRRRARTQNRGPWPR